MSEGLFFSSSPRYKASMSIKKMLQHVREGDPVIHAPVSAKARVQLREVRDILVEVQSYNPIEFLGKIMQGEPVPSKYIDEDGNEHITFLVPAMKDRVRAAQFLANKMIPTMHAHKIVNEREDNNEFDTMVERAIAKSAQSN